MDLNELMDGYMEEGLTRELAAARVCQDIVLKAISIICFLQLYERIKLILFMSSEILGKRRIKMTNQKNEKY